MPFDYGEKRPDGQYERHPGLDNPAQQPKVRPVRTSYKHETCGGVTSMPQHCAETYAAKPDYYGSTFCAVCREYFKVGADGEFVWLDDGTKVGT